LATARDTPATARSLSVPLRRGAGLLLCAGLPSRCTIECAEPPAGNEVEDSVFASSSCP